MAGIARAQDKLFNLTSNYPKGDGDAFRSHMEEYNPDALLIPVPSLKGNRQDIVMLCAAAIYMNRPYYIEYLDKRLKARNASKKKKSNILEENSWIVLSSLIVVACFRGLSIVHYAIIVPFRWLAGNSHTLSEYGWSVRSMGRAVDIIFDSMTMLANEPEKLIDESFMMHIFDPLINELPPLKDYLHYYYNDKKSYKIVRDQIKHQPHQVVRNELFNPDDASNVETDYLMEEIATIIAETYLKELQDPKKATFKHVSNNDGIYSWKNTTEAEKEAGLGLFANNNVSESTFGGLSNQVNTYTMIGLNNAGGMALARQNGDFNITRTRAKNKNKGKYGEHQSIISNQLYLDIINNERIGIMHKLSTPMYNSLLIMARNFRPHKAKQDTLRLKASRDEKRKRDELALELNIEKASAKHIETLFRWEKYEKGEFWTTEEEVIAHVSQVEGVTAKRNTLKDKITDYVKGFGWDEYHTTWSVGGRPHSVEYLQEHLLHIIRDSRAKGKEKNKPKINIPLRKKLPTIGMSTVDVRAKTEEVSEDITMMESRSNSIRNKLIDRGERDEMSLKQPKYVPKLKENDVIQYALKNSDDSDDSVVIEWCTGTVVRLSDGSNLRNTTGKGPKYHRKGSAVEIKWHADEEKGEEVSYSVVEIKKTMFNCYADTGWRLFFNVRWNNKMLQSKYNIKNKNDDEERSQDNEG